MALARALASQPKAVLLDEPLGDQDVSIKEKLLPRFKEALKVMAAPVLYVTHDPAEAELVGEKFSCLVRGRIDQAAVAAEAFAAIRASEG